MTPREGGFSTPLRMTPREDAEPQRRHPLCGSAALREILLPLFVRLDSVPALDVAQHGVVLDGAEPAVADLSALDGLQQPLAELLRAVQVAPVGLVHEGGAVADGLRHQ